MNSKTSSTRHAVRALHARASVLSLAIATTTLACSVYDESLRQGSGLSPTGGADNGPAAGTDAGGSASANGGADSSTGGELVEGGAPSSGGKSGTMTSGGASVGGRGGNASGGRAGAANGGSGGFVAVAGSGGMLANGGSGGAGGNGGTSVSGGTSVGGAAGSAPELGVGKPTTASTAQPANPSSSGNDGQASTRYSATSATLPQWWRVDLGVSHALTQVSIQFEFPDRKYTYAVETSADDATYTKQANVVDGVGATQTVTIPNHATARYVRITCTATVPGVDPMTGASRPTWMSFWEVSVQGN